MSNDSLNECPNCHGPADNGHDRCHPPATYWCTKCMKLSEPPNANTVVDEKTLIRIAGKAYMQSGEDKGCYSAKAMGAAIAALRPSLRTTEPVREDDMNLLQRLFFTQGYALNFTCKNGGGGGTEKTLKASIKRAMQSAKYGDTTTIHYHMNDGSIAMPPIMIINSEQR